MTAVERIPFVETATLYSSPQAWRDAVAALRRHPDFPRALRHLVRRHLGLIAQYPETRNIINDRGKYQAAIVALALHATFDPAEPRSGLTGERLRRRCIAMRLCSRGRVLSILDGLRAAGHIERAPAGEDGRVRRLQPTAAMLAFHAERLRVQCEATAIVCPDDAPLFAGLADAAGVIAMAEVQSDGLHAGRRQLALSPAMSALADTTAASLILIELTATALGDGGADLPERAEIPLSISALSRRHGVSRKHVLKVLTQAEAAQLVLRPVAGGDRIVVLPVLIDEVANFAAAMMLTTTAIAAAATARLESRDVF